MLLNFPQGAAHLNHLKTFDELKPAQGSVRESKFRTNTQNLRRLFYTSSALRTFPFKAPAIPAHTCVYWCALRKRV